MRTFALSTKIFMLEYVAIATGLILIGDPVLITTVYFALFGHLNLAIILAMSFTISNLMDVVLYYIGKMGVKRVFKSLPFVERYEKNHPKIMEIFSKHQLKIIFFSRFLHGSGTSIMILSGVYHVPFKKYMAMNILSSLTILTFIPTIVFFTKTSASVISSNIKIVEWIVALAVLIIFLSIRFNLGNFVNKILFPRKKTE